MANAAGALAGMARRDGAAARRREAAVVASMFGVTTPCVTPRASGSRSSATRCSSSTRPARAAARWRSCSRRASSSASLDVTTTEFCDQVAGGVLAGGARAARVGRAGRASRRSSRSARSTWSTSARGTPCPERYRDRNLYVHNPTITLMRTTPEECREIGRRHRAEAQRGDGPDRALRAAARRLGDRDRGPAVPRPRGRRGAVLDAARGGRRDEGRGARARRRRQRPGVRARDGEPAARADRRRAHDAERGARAAARARSTRAARSSAPAPAPASRRSAPRPAAPT